ncbi:uncharacterized protein SEPMUDRAFT_127480 [Sphaerulina musiva SO2202]|uniref:Uncharacterized protein n=1 Tax=Sphaerulina musiva (strain SO2202) TaxID=692275 RepID=N1QEL0_SPHMS|nr:uncharacterized protein SEPMUDRAFT_127480 [Sphaerulina musiva SO2202]EMF10896.1 hypothetical protein SEPMUDRAFT_127480 [Sphaerulina musiva SO2202]
MQIDTVETWMIWISSNTTALALVAFIILCGLLAFGVLAQQVIVGASRIGVLLAMDHYKSLSAHTIIVRVEYTNCLDATGSPSLGRLTLMISV